MRSAPRYTRDTSHRFCRDCWRDLPAVAFWRTGKGHLDSYCKRCKGVRSRLEYRRNGLARRHRKAA